MSFQVIGVNTVDIGPLYHSVLKHVVSQNMLIPSIETIRNTHPS